MNFLKDFDYRIRYHPEKRNVVADTLSRKGIGVLAHLMISELELCKAMQ